MGTRSYIQVVGADNLNRGRYMNAVRLYRHNDGDPPTMLPAIARAIEKIEQLAKASSIWQNFKERVYGVESVAHAIVAETMSAAFLSVRIEAVINSTPKLVHLGDQSDIEWLYVIDCKDRLVNIYTTKADPAKDGCGEPREHLEAGLLKDCDGVLRRVYVPEAQDEQINACRSAIDAIENAGWGVSKQADPYLRLTQRSLARRNRAAELNDVLPLVAETSATPLASAYCI